MAYLNCKICAKEFYIKPSHLKLRGYGKYCSRKCRVESQRKGRFIKCHTCKNSAWKMPKELKHSKSGKFFCSKSCQTKWRNITFVGPKHGSWKDGSSTYRTVLLRHNILRICKLCANKDTRILAVHHIDHIHKNNKLNNLCWLCHNCHFLVHHDKSEKEKLMGTMV